MPMKGEYKYDHFNSCWVCEDIYGANVRFSMKKISRTFLAWLHVVVMLAGASVTIVTFASGQGIVEQLFGIILLPVSVAYIFYALSQCKSCYVEF